MTTNARVTEHYERAARELVEGHAKLERSPLVVAVRYRRRGLDLHLLEVIENFPGADDDDLLATDFAPNERLVILGKLHLSLASPAQLRHALAHPSASTKKLIAAIRKDGQLLYEATAPTKRAREAKALQRALELP